MARVKFSGLIDSINGSIGGTTFQRNRYGNTIKAKRSATRPQTASQKNRQQQLGYASRRWRSLSAANRTAWETYAQTFPVASRLNPDVNLSGFNYFLRYHEYRAMTGNVSVLSDPNGTRNDITSTDPLLTQEAGVLDFTPQALDINESTFCIVKMSFEIRASLNNFKSLLRIVGSKDIEISQQIELQTGFISAFGGLPADNSIVGLEMIFVNFGAGQIDKSIIQKIEVEPA